MWWQVVNIGQYGLTQGLQCWALPDAPDFDPWPPAFGQIGFLSILTAALCASSRQMQDLYKQFTTKEGTSVVVNGITTEFPPGQTVALLGPSGSGATLALVACTIIGAALQHVWL